MLKQYDENIYKICEVLMKILEVKNVSKISFSMLNDLFDLDMEDNKLADKVSKITKNNPKLVMPSILLLFMQESFEYFVKYEDKYNDIKNRLFELKDLHEMARLLKEDMWPFYPFFQEALSVFATLFYPDIYGGVTDLDLVLESSIKDLVFVDNDGFQLPISFFDFFNKAETFVIDTYEIEKNNEIYTNTDFHEISNIVERIKQEYSLFTNEFMNNYIRLNEYLINRYNAVIEKLNNISIKLISPEINATYKYTLDKINELTFRIKDCKNLDTLEIRNQDVNDLKVYSVTRFNEFTDFINNNSLEKIPNSYNWLLRLLEGEDEGKLDYLYVLIDEKIKVLEAKYEKKKRKQIIRDLSIKIKNFSEFLIGLKTEIGDMNYITKRQIANFKSKDKAEFFLNRLKIQKSSYFKHVRVFDYLSMSHDIETDEFKIYKRNELDNIVENIKTLEKFLTFVTESMLPEVEKEIENDFENEGRIIDINGNNINVQLMSEDYSELSISSDDIHTFNIHDYSAYHKLVDFALDVRKQPVFQDYGDISEYPYFKPFKYQVDSVRTMLQRFEGRGVFGDQVGLGKTLEALMCADVMFRCATIKNAVIVTTKATIRQWRNEAETKFRHEDGTPMFEVYPKHNSYSFRELIKELVKDRKTKDSNALKVYLVSIEQIKSPDTLEFIEETGKYFGLKNMAYNNTPFEQTDVKVLDLDINSITSFKHLDIIRKRLFNELKNDIKNSLENNEKYKKLTTFNVYGFFTYEFDEASKCFIPTNNSLYDENNLEECVVLDEVNLLKKYTKKLSLIDERKNQIENELESFKEKYSYADKRLIDLLIFDEVQDLLYDFNKEGNKEQLLQEFIANIQKKYCILISATPIKNDLSDIFNLLYMVDKNRLGETKEKAEIKFYNAYCGGAKSLAEMAEKMDAETRFKKLNGLINSMFTRKRLYDKDVLDSIKRHSATPQEIEYSFINGRDDYGGQAFIRLIGAIRRAKQELNKEDPELFINKSLRPLFPKYNLSSEVLKDAFLKLSDYVDEAAKICINRLECELRMKLNNFNVYDKFIENYQLLLKCEKENNKDEIYQTIIKTCDLLTNFINRGLLAFYRSYQNYPLVFLSDYIDWRRPRKRGEKLIVDTDINKIEIFKNLLVINDDNNKYNIEANNLNALYGGKILFYEKKPKIRHDIYEAIKNTKPSFGNIRRVYMTLNVQDEGLYNIKDFIHFCYFPKGIKKEEMKKEIAIINSKNKNELTFDESRLLANYSLNGNLLKDEALEDTFKDLNFKNFTEFTANNENWNSIYFIDKTMIMGTDFNAANILIIGQLDKQDGSYLDPLEMEQLIGRISRIGQTEECIVFTALYNGNDETKYDKEFNEIYYDILTDEEGFDLYGVCQTEVDFVMPVVLACANRLFSREHSYLANNKNEFDNDLSEFKSLYKDEYIEYNGRRFPDLIKYAYANNDKIDVYYKNKIYKPIDAIKEMIRLYSNILKPEPIRKEE